MFTIGFQERLNPTDDDCFIVCGPDGVYGEAGNVKLERSKAETVVRLASSVPEYWQLGSDDSGRRYWLALLAQSGSLATSFLHAREYFGLQNPEPDPALRAIALAKWRLRYRCCTRCGRELVPSKTESALSCAPCEEHFYPVICPAVIVAITRVIGYRKHILLCKGVNRARDWWSLVAGFVEAGESVEDAVRREVAEETGLVVGNISYQGSQSWPISNSLMLSFTAEFGAGELTPDPREIEAAQWFPLDDIPEIPPKWTIAARLVRACQSASSIFPKE